MILETFITVSLQLVERSKFCEFERKDILTFEISYLSSNVTLDVNSPDAKILFCKPWKEFPNLLITEVDLGSAGPSGDRHDIELIIYDSLTKELRQVLRKKIREEKLDAAGVKAVWENPYSLEKTKDGKPAVRMTKSAEVIKIN